MKETLKSKLNRKDCWLAERSITSEGDCLCHLGESIRDDVVCRTARIFHPVSRDHGFATMRYRAAFVVNPRGLERCPARRKQNRTAPGTYSPTAMHYSPGSVQRCSARGDYCTAQKHYSPTTGDNCTGLKHNCTTRKHYSPGPVHSCTARKHYSPTAGDNCTGLKHNCTARKHYFPTVVYYCSTYKLNHYTSGYWRGRGVDAGSEYRRI